jgi:hypothetical protein
VNIVEAIENPQLFQSIFQDLKSWQNWIVLLKALFAIPMSKKDRSLYQECTGRKKPSKKPVRELWTIVGRRGGKSRIVSVVAVYLGLFHSFKEYLAPGERGVIQVIAADRAQARVIFRYISAILHSTPVFKQ